MAIDYLLVTSGQQAGTEIRPAPELVVGRAVDAEGELRGDPEISRRHARLTRRDGGALVIEDLGSANGTYVNGDRITAPRELHPSDVVRVGATTIEARGVASRSGAAGEDQTQPAGELTGGVRATREAGRPERTGLEAGRALGEGGSRPAPEAAAAGVADDSVAVAEPIEQAGSPSALRRVPPMPGGAPPAAELVYEGRRIPVPLEGLTIGRGSDNDLVIPVPTVSRRQAQIVAEAGRHYVADLGSANGTELNGERLRSESRWLTSGDAIALGGRQLRYLAGRPTRLDAVTPVFEPRVVRFEDRRMTIGRDRTNDVVLDGPNVSRFHAEVVLSDGGLELRDLDSRNGTRLDGRVVRRAPVETGSEIAVGPFRLIFDGTSFLQRDDRGALRLRVDELSVRAGEKTILNRASLSVEPGELVVIIGESGSGKSTLLKALAGATTPTSGVVAVNGDPVASRLTDIGYVPQDDIVHRRLTVRESLRYSARLRLPRDSSDADIDAAVQRVLEELALEPHADTLIGSLSGGQRKRTGLATELLNRPSLLFLDEPTTGMDPGLETRMMELFRELAAQGTRALVVVTHATKNLALADKVAVMGRGGELAYLGDPEAAKRFFGVDDYDGIYTALDERAALEWRREFDAGRRLSPASDLDTESVRLEPEAARERAAWRRPRTGRQAGILAHRYLTLVARDRRNLLILLGQVLVFGLGIALLFRAGVLDAPGKGRPADAAKLLFLLVITEIWIGMVDGSREIIKERALLDREAAVGVRLEAYLTSKAVVLFPLLAVQTALLLAIVFGIRPASESAQSYAAVFGILAMTGFVAVAMGLLISSLVGSEDQATSFLPLALIPQLLFAGSIVSVKNMAEPVATVADIVFARWSFAGAGSALDMNDRIAGDPQLARVDEFEPSFFDLSEPAALLIQLIFLVLFLGGVATLLRRQGS
jgi:ABC transport system ATP-binding/permease protein